MKDAPPKPPSRPDVREIQAIFQQWKAPTLNLAERLSALVGEASQEMGEQDIQAMHPLRAMREARNVTRERLAEEAGMGAAAIKRAEGGESINLESRRRLCAFFGCSAEGLGRADRKQGRPNLKLRHHRTMRNLTQAELADERSRMCPPREINTLRRGMMSTGMVSSWDRGEHLPGPFWQKKL